MVICDMLEEEILTEITSYDLKDCEIALESVEEEIQDILYKYENCTSSNERVFTGNLLLDMQEKKRLINKRLKQLKQY